MGAQRIPASIEFQDLSIVHPTPRVACGWFTRDSRRHFFEVYELGGVTALRPVRHRPKDPDYVIDHHTKCEIEAAYEAWRLVNPRY